jgi:tripartite-type tricarboxylate transporter receptor subunit TctC
MRAMVRRLPEADSVASNHRKERRRLAADWRAGRAPSERWPGENRQKTTWEASMRIASRVLAVAACLLLAGRAPAQDWPSRPLSLVVPFAAGGGADILARILATSLSDILGQPVTVENVGGGGGVTGALRVSHAAPDGYQLLLGTTGTHAHSQALYKNPPYNAVTDFTPVALVAEQPILLVTRKDFPAANLAEFIAYAREHQARMQYGSAGTGSGVHLACVLLNTAIGVNVVHVPYRGTAPAMQDLIAGRIDYQCPVITPAVPLIKGGLVKAIATLTKNRTPLMPDLATAREQGREQGLSDFEAYIWFAIFLPRAAPADIVRKLNQAIATVENLPTVRERLKDIGSSPIVPERQTPEYLAAFVEREVAKWSAPVRASGVGLD